MGRQNARALLTHVRANSRRSRALHRQGRKRQSQDFAGGILTGYLWKLNPPILLLGDAPAFRHPRRFVEYPPAYPDDRRLSSVLFPSR